MSADHSREGHKTGSRLLSWESPEDRDWQDFNPKYQLRQLDEYVDKLHNDLKKFKRDAQREVNAIWTERTQFAEKLADAEHKVRELTKDKNDLEKQLDESDTKLGDARKKNAEQDKEIRKISRMLSEAQDKQDIYQKRLNDATKALEDERVRLSERVAKEARHEVSVMLNRIATMLITDYRQMERMQTAPLTMEVGEELRDQLKSLFTKLSQLGVDFVKDGK